MESSDPRSVQWQLPAALLDALEHQAGTEGLPAERIAARVLEAGLIDLVLMPNGRCSPI
ncbi:MAG: hypothetical protein ACK5GZ_07120 [Cyanobium sp.]|jgi:hypothetical protein